MTTKKRIPIHFDNVKFDKLNELYWTKVGLQKKIEQEFKKLLAKPDMSSIDYSNALDEFYKQLELEKKEQNTLLTLLEINWLNYYQSTPTTSRRLQVDHAKVKDAVQPNAEDHTTYAQTSEELQRHAVCIEVIKALVSAKPYTSNYYNFVMTNRMFNPLISWDANAMQYVPNYLFIKDYF
jgi:paraquat-inducible protein B